jgi:hypothetical protein
MKALCGLLIQNSKVVEIQIRLTETAYNRNDVGGRFLSNLNGFTVLSGEKAVISEP